MKVARPTLITASSPLYQGALLDDEWSFEFKLDGDRVIYQRDEDGKEETFNRRMEPYEHHVTLSVPNNTILDGEYYRGKYFVFDIVKLDGHDIYWYPLEERREILDDLHVLQVPKPYEKDNPLLDAEYYGYEGVVIKKLTEGYPFKKSSWLKVRL